MHRAREPFRLHRVEPDGLGHVAQRAARAVTDDRGSERGALTTILAIDVLDDLFAPLVLEVDVDVGWLVTFARDETLHEQLAARGVHLGDTQAITHHRVRGRAAALAQDAESPCFAHDVVHREEVGLVGEIGDERELVVDPGAQVLRDAGRPAPERAGFRELAQVGSRRLTRRHQFARIFVAQLVERKIRQRRDFHGFREQRGRIEPRQPFAFTQVPLAIGEQPLAGFGQRHPVTYRRERILQRTAIAQVHVHVTGGRERQTELRAQRTRHTQAFAVATVARQLHRDPGASRKSARHPRTLPGRVCRRCRRQPQCERAGAASRAVARRRAIEPQELFDVGAAE